MLHLKGTGLLFWFVKTFRLSFSVLETNGESHVLAVFGIGLELLTNPVIAQLIEGYMMQGVNQGINVTGANGAFHLKSELPVPHLRF